MFRNTNYTTEISNGKEEEEVTESCRGLNGKEKRLSARDSTQDRDEERGLLLGR